MTETPGNTDTLWRAVVTRDPAFIGRFVMAVTTTGIYCRPGCPARTPKRENVRFFPDAAAARNAGFRPCKRCRPDGSLADEGLDLVVAACRTIEAGLEDDDSPWTHRRLAAALKVSPRHLDRAFRRHLGLTPRAYGEARRLDRLRAALTKGDTVTSAVYAAGFDGPRRVYELAGRTLGMTPGRFAKGGAGETIRYTAVVCSLGTLLVAATEKGLCRTMIGNDAETLVQNLEREFHAAKLVPGDVDLADITDTILTAMEAGHTPEHIPLDIQATAFQAAVWRMLAAIRPGQTLTYGEIARSLGKPGAARAVGRACGANPVAVVIPCHRAVGRDGALTGYAWGTARKRALLKTEGEDD